MTKPRTQRAELAQALDRIDSVRRSLDFVAAHLADVHLLAYEPATGERSGGSGSGEADKIGGFLGRKPGDDATKARAICGVVLGAHCDLADAEVTWTAVAASVAGLLGGEGAVSGMRGTLLLRADYDAAIAAQRRRQARNADPDTAPLAEYQPTAIAGQRQPTYPGPRGAVALSTPGLPKPDKPKRGWRTDRISEEP